MLVNSPAVPPPPSCHTHTQLEDRTLLASLSLWALPHPVPCPPPQGETSSLDFVIITPILFFKSSFLIFLVMSEQHIVMFWLASSFLRPRVVWDLLSAPILCGCEIILRSVNITICSFLFLLKSVWAVSGAWLPLTLGP